MKPALLVLGIFLLTATTLLLCLHRALGGPGDDELRCQRIAAGHRAAADGAEKEFAKLGFHDSPFAQDERAAAAALDAQQLALAIRRQDFNSWIGLFTGAAGLFTLLAFTMALLWPKPPRPAALLHPQSSP